MKLGHVIAFFAGASIGLNTGKNLTLKSQQEIVNQAQVNIIDMGPGQKPDTLYSMTADQLHALKLTPPDAGPKNTHHLKR